MQDPTPEDVKAAEEFLTDEETPSSPKWESLDALKKKQDDQQKKLRLDCVCHPSTNGETTREKPAEVPEGPVLSDNQDPTELRVVGFAEEVQTLLDTLRQRKQEILAKIASQKTETPAEPDALAKLAETLQRFNAMRASGKELAEAHDKAYPNDSGMTLDVEAEALDAQEEKEWAKALENLPDEEPDWVGQELNADKAGLAAAVDEYLKSKPEETEPSEGEDVQEEVRKALLEKDLGIDLGTDPKEDWVSGFLEGATPSDLEGMWDTVPDVSHMFPTGNGHIPMSPDYHPAVNISVPRKPGEFRVEAKQDYANPAAAPVLTVRQFAERRLLQEKKLSERNQSVQSAERQLLQEEKLSERDLGVKTAAAAAVGTTGSATATLAPQEPKLTTVELIEWAGPNGLAVYMLSPETRREVLDEDPSVEPLIQWVEGPVWAAILKMTGWPASRIITLDIRVRVLPPL